MPYGDVAEAARALDAQYGANASSVMPTTNELALFTGVPAAFGGDGVETDYPSYARVTVNNADWPDADPDLATKTLTVDWPDATEPDPDPDPFDWGSVDDITHWVMFHSDGTTVVAYGSWDSAISLDAAGAVSGDVVLYNPNDSNVTD